MRKALILVAAIAASACGGNSSTLSQQDAESVASQIAMAIPDASSERNLFTFGGSFGPTTLNCAQSGSITVSGSLSIDCPSGLRSCTTTGSATVTADQCVVASGAEIDGSVTATVTGTGISFTKTVTGMLTVTPPGGEPQTCDVSFRLSFGHVSGSICGVSISK